MRSGSRRSSGSMRIWITRIEYVARVYVPTADYWSVCSQFLLLERQELKKKNIVIFSDSTYLVCSGEKSHKSIDP